MLYISKCKKKNNMNNCINQTESIPCQEPIQGEINGIKLPEENKNPNEIQKKELNSFYSSNIITKTFFLWTLYATQLANKKSLKIPDFQSIEEEDRAENLLKPVSEKWYLENGKIENENYPKNLLFKSILKAYYKKIIILSILNLITNLLKYLQIYFYDSIIKNFQHHHDPEEESPLFPVSVNAVGIILSKVLTTFFHHHTKFNSEISGTRAENAISALIYEKVTKSSIFIKNQISEGEIINYIQVDAEKLNYLFTSLPAIIVIPVNIVISFYALFKFFGLTFFAGIGTLIVLIIIIWIIQWRYLVNTKIMLHKKDKRMRLTTHTLHIMKILKLFGWEEEFKENIDMKRNDELINIKNIFILIALRTFFNSNIAILTSLTSIGVYIHYHGAMDIDDLFTSFQLIEEVAEPMVNVPQYIADLESLKISLNRIQDFLVVRDIEKKVDEKVELEDGNNNDSFKNALIKKEIENGSEIENENAIEYKNCDFGIKGNINEENTILLKGLNFRIKKGDLVILIGETGSGKSCLINSILNNLDLINQDNPEIKYYYFSPIISYAAQDPWIMNGTIRDNIIFYSEFNEEKYNQVVNACQLDKDFKNFKHSDMTEVGSTGNNISGGQRARISLARALYRDADIYLFDDPIPSVDTFVSMKIFHQAIINFLKNKTRIFVTHDLRNLKYSSRIVKMNNFKIEFNGNYNEFLNNENYKNINEINAIQNNNYLTNKNSLLNNNITEINGEFYTNKDETFGGLLKDEDQASGRITCRIYHRFFTTHGNYGIFSIILILSIGMGVLSLIAKLFLMDWSDKAEEEDEVYENDADIIKKEDNYKYFIKYALFLLGGLVVQLIKEFIVAYSNYTGTKYLHETMIYNIIRAPINLFHDIIPIGQILNRLIHDLEMCQDIIWRFNTILHSIIEIIISFYVCFIENRETIYAAPVIILIAILLLIYYIPAGRDINRLNGTSRSPIVSLFSETILGITTIRTFNQEIPSKNKFYKKLDDYFGVMLYRYGMDNWFCMTLDVVSHLFLTYVLIGTILDMDDFDDEAIALMLDYSIEISEALLEAFEQASQVERSLVSLERCDAFTRLPSEDYQDEKLIEKKYNLSDISWPNEGKVIFDNFSVKYRDDCDLALKNINLEINPGEKIGIIGRTGSGKSSLTLSLFRIIEALEGNIYIDGENIHDVPLKKLRRSLSIVPQEPFLLEGTLKTNLDPLNLYSDSELEEVLKIVKLYEMLEHDKANQNTVLNGLNTEIKEYGNNLSFGCRQLLCVARAILRKSKIIILDEATSSVDQKTEDIITNAVDTMYKDSTIINIAHRINTVKACDKVIIIDEGQIVEVGNPNELIKYTNSKFYSLYYQYMEK